MPDGYGRAAFEKKSRQKHPSQVDKFVRMEYGRRAGSGFIHAEVADRLRHIRRRRRRALKKIIHSLVRAVRVLVPGVHAKARQKATDQTE